MTLAERLNEGLMAWWIQLISASQKSNPNYETELTRNDREPLCLTIKGTKYLMKFIPANQEDIEAFKEKQRRDLSSQGKKTPQIGKLIGKMQLPEVAIVAMTNLKHPISQHTNTQYLRVISDIEKQDPLKGEKKAENRGIFGDLEIYHHVDINLFSVSNSNSFLTRRPIYQIPRGENGGISERLYWHVRRTMLQPLTLMY